MHSSSNKLLPLLDQAVELIEQIAHFVMQYCRFGPRPGPRSDRLGPPWDGREIGLFSSGYGKYIALAPSPAEVLENKPVLRVYALHPQWREVALPFGYGIQSSSISGTNISVPGIQGGMFSLER